MEETPIGASEVPKKPALEPELQSMVYSYTESRHSSVGSGFQKQHEVILLSIIHRKIQKSCGKGRKKKRIEMPAKRDLVALAGIRAELDFSYGDIKLLEGAIRAAAEWLLKTRTSETLARQEALLKGWCWEYFSLSIPPKKEEEK